MEKQIDNKHIACKHCDLLISKTALLPGQKAHCPRCGSRLYFVSRSSPSAILALCLTALILLVPANIYPLLSLTMVGITDSVSLISAVEKVYQEGDQFIALLILLCVTLAPALMLLALASASFCISFNLLTPILKPLLKAVDVMTHWSMLEVYLVSFLVALVKLVDLGDVHLGLGLVCFIALMLVNSMILSVYDAETYWNKVKVDVIR
ncbi:paraquat-inducible protein A [Motilimonas pumila]|uniref:Paraquat-inducible protein A n=1 Tax=Motilimonas pumila TaxID=2303987 RepID=A0A418YCP2_9GAMM|nr:paraquat-inducible protein A [Motilimonas pumila]RJG42265.1 paraquat-inducible protein A [Motilimonas pumila]